MKEEDKREKLCIFDDEYALTCKILFIYDCSIYIFIANTDIFPKFSLDFHFHVHCQA